MTYFLKSSFFTDIFRVQAKIGQTLFGTALHLLHHLGRILRTYLMQFYESEVATSDDIQDSEKACVHNYYN